MKKIFLILSVCFMASLAIVGCKKDPKPTDKQEQSGENTKTWDYTPGEAYNAEGNLWKATASSISFFYYSCTGADWNGENIESDNPDFVTLEQSTYKIHYASATTLDWQNQIFFRPKNAIALSKKMTYKLSVTIGASKDARAFFKFSVYGPEAPKHEGACIWDNDKSNIPLTAFEPVVLESPVISGVECDNINLIFDFGRNPEDVDFFVKDITLIAEPAPEKIQIDGNFEDWADVNYVCTNLTNAESYPGISELKAYTTEGFVFVYVKGPANVLTDKLWNNLRILIDQNGDDDGLGYWGAPGKYDYMVNVYALDNPTGSGVYAEDLSGGTAVSGAAPGVAGKSTASDSAVEYEIKLDKSKFGGANDFAGENIGVGAYSVGTDWGLKSGIGKLTLPADCEK